MYISVVRDLTGALQQGTFILRKNMTPDQLVSALLAPPEVKYVDIGLRTGLRLEQITAKLETLPLQMDASEFYDLGQVAAGRARRRLPVAQDDPRHGPEGRIARGFLWPATYRVLPGHDARGTRPAHARQVRAQRRAGPDERPGRPRPVVLPGPDARLDRRARGPAPGEKPLIAGVYQNRLDPEEVAARAAPVGPDDLLRPRHARAGEGPRVATWTKYVFWAPIEGGLTSDALPPDLAGYNTYKSTGLPPGPICTPTITSIDAALEPDTKAGYLYFLAKGDGSGTTAFAKTFKEHQANIKKYLKK